MHEESGGRGGTENHRRNWSASAECMLHARAILLATHTPARMHKLCDSDHAPLLAHVIIKVSFFPVDPLSLCMA